MAWAASRLESEIINRNKYMKRLAIIVLSVWAGLAGALTAHAQSVTTIYCFTNPPANPNAGLTLGPDGNFYGTTSYGGGTLNVGPGYGAVFNVAPNGTVTTLVNFNN